MKRIGIVEGYYGSLPTFKQRKNDCRITRLYSHRPRNRKMGKTIISSARSMANSHIISEKDYIIKLTNKLF